MRRSILALFALFLFWNTFALADSVGPMVPATLEKIEPLSATTSQCQPARSDVGVLSTEEWPVPILTCTQQCEFEFDSCFQACGDLPVCILQCETQYSWCIFECYSS